ncbi:hypothetical protein M0805_009583 [Coniferiporia weirii]|nr:hypothetical protein M0805_009583 [Coniferiporia weirii]
MSYTAQGVVPVDLSLTLGALQIGTYISTTLFGVMSMQTYYFYVNFPNERKLLKGLVAWIWLFELLHAAFVTCSIFEMSVKNFGNFAEFVPLKVSIVWSATVAFSIQAFFAYRIRIMSQRWEITLVCWTLSLMQYLTSLIDIAKWFKLGNFIEFDHKPWGWTVAAVLGVTMANDIIIAASLSYHLYRNRSGIPSTERLIHRLIKFTIQTGLLTRRALRTL